MKTGLGMDKVPMSYFGLVEEGKPFRNKTTQLKTLYNSWDINIKKSQEYCSQKGTIFLDVWNIQERIRPRIPASDIIPSK